MAHRITTPTAKLAVIRGDASLTLRHGVVA